MRRAALDAVRAGARRLAVGLIRAYQVAIAPALGAACRYEPSCSRFAIEAVETHGLWKGGWLAARRLSRCHPLGGHGYDPVPAKLSRPTPARPPVGS